MYQFVQLPDFTAMRIPLHQHCVEQGIKGTILLAEEGLNGTIAGSQAAIDSLLTYLRSDLRFAGIQAKQSLVCRHAFSAHESKVKKRNCYHGCA